MKIVASIMKNNPCYKTGKTITVKGLMLHSVGTPQPKASAFISSWNRASYKRACVHAFIDGNNGDTYQTLPWNHRGWHCGSGKKGSGNNTHIGVEMCEPANIRYTSGSTFTCTDKKAAITTAKRTYDSAVELFAMLCRQYGLDPLKDGVIISHREGHERGIASNHGDPEHLWKGLGMKLSMDKFRRAVKTKMEDKDIAVPPVIPPKETPKKKFVPYLVRVGIDDLIIRKGPGTDYAKTGKYTGKGTFTIVEEADGKGASKWGKLKSKAGWISLDYTSKVSEKKSV